MGYAICFVSYSCLLFSFLHSVPEIIASLFSIPFPFVSDRDQCGKCRAGTRRLNLNKYCRRDYGKYSWRQTQVPASLPVPSVDIVKYSAL
jgi:hypothetical protein